MAATMEKATQHMGETKGMDNHDYDMVQELSHRLQALWRYDQYMANAQGDARLQGFWQELKRQDQENVQKLKQFIADHVRKNCF